MANNSGKIAQVIGPVIDVSFQSNSDLKSELPNILDALEVKKEDGTSIILECQQHIGEDAVRTIAMESTDGLRRGLEVIGTGSPIKMPVGDDVKGRLFNVIGDTIDGIGPLDKNEGYPIHRDPPAYEDLSTQAEVLFTGIKVIDLIEPYAKG